MTCNGWRASVSTLARGSGKGANAANNGRRRCRCRCRPEEKAGKISRNLGKLVLMGRGVPSTPATRMEERPPPSTPATPPANPPPARERRTRIAWSPFRGTGTPPRTGLQAPDASCPVGFGGGGRCATCRFPGKAGGEL
jgi:hypothetical protein